ncbi:helix-turn-helix transcriptional regulator [Paenibacillus sp. YIM B09110]|uniref:helix-turn-helix transcriptional regulator n=1 Tax=Paenibacillus sp. YIM B09110 TaxID=3126102 RepID=UPI00301C13CC
MSSFLPALIEPMMIDILLIENGSGLLIVGDHKIRATSSELYIVPVSTEEKTSSPATTAVEVIRYRVAAETLGMAAPLVPMRWTIINGKKAEFKHLLIGLLENHTGNQALQGRCGHWTRFLELLLSEPGGAVLQPCESDDSPIRQALNVMGYRFMNPLTVAEISRVVAMSSRHFQRMFKSLTGRSFVQMLQEIRLRHSCALLQFTNLSVQMVAETVGFSDMHHFYRLFRNRCGVTPAAFRLQYRY